MADKHAHVLEEIGILIGEKAIHEWTAETVFHQHAEFFLGYVHWIKPT